MPPAVVMAPVHTRSSLELMLELIQKRDELAKDAPPALPSRPTSRGRLPSSRRSLPLNFKTRSISPEPFVKEDSDKMEMKREPLVKVDEEFPVQNRFFESHNKLKNVDQLEESFLYVNKPQAERSDEENSREIGRLIYQMSGSVKVEDKILMKIAQSEDVSCQALLQIVGVEKCPNGVHACSSYEDLKKGATLFQSFVRGEIARRTFQFLMKRRMAVVIIQKYVRRWIARTKFFNQKEDIIHLQAVVRGQLAQKQSIILKNLRMSNKLNEASSNWHLHKNFQETKEYVLVHHSVMEDLQMRVLKAEASLREKEEIHLSFQHQLEQYEMKMILMEEMWQKKMSLQDLNERHFEAHHSVKTELQRQILKAKGALMQKEEENIKLQQDLHQYEIKWSQYEMKMKSMEEKWQKQLTSLQLSLAAARKRLADDSVSLPERSDSSSLWHSYDSESSMSTEARSPESTLAKHPHASGAGIRNDFTRKQKAVNVLVQEFEQRKQAFEDDVRFLMEAKSQQLDRSSNPDVELQKLKIEFTSWKKDYKVRLREAKSAIHKLSKARKDKPRKNWWCT
ncbi:P-loop containing nucleoside triphosphate hydrolase protein [Dioscorea alata]|uniref:P-loop containing nucleoside triphosphate hydrolase protein n=2 Tax=Dioscorea alata TaxID=55571 RepID=A0ACB7VP48_DIOAL|nr:P-loop containing nucleoside triphosphate hydrolase protein [Dioscorea alata]KAH7675808.1 P-loop containing nucleoside triphosphate hydrolase protein [Dioscorea alata]